MGAGVALMFCRVATCSNFKTARNVLPLSPQIVLRVVASSDEESWTTEETQTETQANFSCLQTEFSVAKGNLHHHLEADKQTTCTQKEVSNESDHLNANTARHNTRRQTQECRTQEWMEPLTRSASLSRTQTQNTQC